MTTTQEIGNRIRRIRINSDHTQDDVAKKLDLTVGAYAKIERGETDPSVTRLFQLAKIFKVDIIFFLKDDAGSAVRQGKDSFVTRSEFESLQKSVESIQKKLGLKDVGSQPVKKSVARKINKS